MDGVWPDDITPLQCAQMLDYYARLVGADHVGMATDDMMRLDLVLAFTKANPSLYNDGGYMINAFNNGAGAFNFEVTSGPHAGVSTGIEATDGETGTLSGPGANVDRVAERSRGPFHDGEAEA